EYLEDSPTLFVVNHFTRAETFIMPYVIHKYTGKYVNSLTDAKLFKGKFGEYLKNIGAVSIREPSRNRRIIGDLLTGRQNWVIYPEGVMVKTKKIMEGGKFFIRHPNRAGPPHTGAAMLGLFSEIYKKYYQQAIKKNDIKTIATYQNNFLFEPHDGISSRPTVIIPVNITYYPIRPGKNLLKRFVKKFFKSLPPRIEEELEIEGNLLLSQTDIHISFGAPIYSSRYLGRFFPMTQHLSPYLKKKGWSYFFFWRQLLKITSLFMKGIYGNVTVNIDHLFCSALYLANKDTFEKSVFLDALYLAARDIKKAGRFQTHRTLGPDLIRMIVHTDWPAIKDITRLAVDLRALVEQNEHWVINKSRLKKKYLFHSARIENTIQVIANELESIRFATRRIQKYINVKPNVVLRKLHQGLLQDDEREFLEDYNSTFEANVSKPRNIGMPYYLPSSSRAIGVVLCHGYMAAPEEVRELAEFLNAAGYHVYAVRLKGHGTTPSDLQNRTWQDWDLSLLRGYAILKNVCDHIILAGFSAGGLLAMNAAQNIQLSKMTGIVSVNAPIRLIQTDSKYVPIINVWNEFLKKFHITKLNKKDFMDNHPENPHINYHKNPLKGVEELMKLMEECQKNLSRLSIPTLICQCDEDPVVHPQSAKIIYDQIDYKDKTLEEIHSKRHGIIRGKGSDVLFKKIQNFIERVTQIHHVRHPL
ncbi:alpha/beta fold hydrolase, partial [PVC group bacterium]|nr:alpha/beta fold hydrolase [PVC group bacterium]